MGEEEEDEEEEEEEEEEGREGIWKKSNNPTLNGGEKHMYKVIAKLQGTE